MVRWFVVCLVALLNAAPAVAAAAQSSTPEASPTGGMEMQAATELAVTLTDAGFEDVPGELMAGRYRVSFSNETAEPAGFVMVQVPEGESYDELAARTTAALEAVFSGASPVAGGEDPAAGFAWLYETGLSGGPGAGPGGTAVATIELSPGQWAVIDDVAFAFEGAPLVTVTGDAAAEEAAPPDAEVTIVETGEGGQGYFFEQTGTLQPGMQTIAISNESDQPHFVDITRLPGPATAEDLLRLFTSDPTASPEPGMPNPEEFVPVAYAGTQSAGTYQWLEVDLEPGFYYLACFVPDPLAGGVPHAFEGMLSVIEVGGDGAATPAA